MKYKATYLILEHRDLKVYVPFAHTPHPLPPPSRVASL